MTRPAGRPVGSILPARDIRSKRRSRDNWNFAGVSDLSTMPKIAFEPCVPTRGTKVPAGPDWIHEIKHDGYRLIVVRDGARAAVHPQRPRLDEALSADRRGRAEEPSNLVRDRRRGRAARRRWHLRFQWAALPQHDDEVQLYAFDILALGGDDLRKLPLALRKTNLAGCWRGGRKAFSSATLSKARLARTSFAPPATSVWRAWFRSAAIAPTAPAGLLIGSR